MDTKSRKCSVSHLLVTCLTFGAGISGVCSSPQSFSFSHHISSTTTGIALKSSIFLLAHLSFCYYSHVQIEVKESTFQDFLCIFPQDILGFFLWQEQLWGVCFTAVVVALERFFYRVYRGAWSKPDSAAELWVGVFSAEPGQVTCRMSWFLLQSLERLPRTICLILRRLSKRNGISFCKSHSSATNHRADLYTCFHQKPPFRHYIQARGMHSKRLGMFACVHRSGPFLAVHS